MFNRLAFIFANTIVLIGIIFVFLDILDVDEEFRISLPIPLLNTIFLASVSVSVALIAFYKFSISGSPELLGIGCATLTLAVGVLVYNWFTLAVLGVRKQIFDCAFLFSPAMHFCGSMLLLSKYGFSKLKPWQRITVTSLCYVVIIFIFLAAAWMLYQGILPLLDISHFLLRAIGAILCIVTAIIYYKHYSKSNLVFRYWYSLSLILLAFGIIFASSGPLEGRLVWWGRLALYASGMYFLIAILNYPRGVKTKEERLLL